MKSVVDNLEAVLRHMAGLYAGLLELAEKKRDAIITGNLNELESILEKEYETLDNVKKAEEIRVALSTQAENEYGIEEADRPLKLKKLIEILGDNAQGLSSAQDEIKDILEKFRFRNRQNEELLKSSIAHVNDFMTLIKERAGKNKTYNKEGRDFGGGLNLLDRRA